MIIQIIEISKNGRQDYLKSINKLVLSNTESD